jgi:hypothetical protein
MSKSNQIKVISISLIVLNIVFLFVPLEMNWDEVKEEYSPFFIYQNTEILIIHFFFLFCLVLNYLIKSRIVYNVTTFVLLLITLLYWLFAIMRGNSHSWYVVGSPYLSTFLPLVLYRFYLIKKLKE